MNFISSSSYSEEEIEIEKLVSKNDFNYVSIFRINWDIEEGKFKTKIMGPNNTIFDISVKTMSANYITVKFKLTNPGYTHMYRVTAMATNKGDNKVESDSSIHGFCKEEPSTNVMLNIMPRDVVDYQWAEDGIFEITLSVSCLNSKDYIDRKEVEIVSSYSEDSESSEEAFEVASKPKYNTKSDDKVEVIEEEESLESAEESNADSEEIVSQYIEFKEEEKVEGTLTCAGLKNQGATCYMNSFLQVMFNIPLIRKCIYSIDTSNEDPNKSIVFNLQKLFVLMQFSKEPVSTERLTRSFGWYRSEANVQHDIEEFSRKIFEAILDKNKGTREESKIKDLISGKIESVVNFPTKQTSEIKTEDFEDIQIVVKDYDSIVESLYGMIQKQVIDDYRTDDGIEKAVKTTHFLHLPDILFMHLARFQYDVATQKNIKINSEFSFPDNLDMSPFMSMNADDSETSDYVLTGVVVHSGNPSGGHYYTYMKSVLANKWYLFNDTVISEATESDATVNNYGGIGTVADKEFYRKLKTYNAYMLIYVRKSKIKSIYKQVTTKDIPERILSCIKEDLKMEEALQEAEHTTRFKLYDISCVVSNFTIGKPPLLNAKVKEFVSVHETGTAADLYNEVSILTDNDKDKIRLWTVVGSNIISEIKCNKMSIKTVPTSSIYLEVFTESIQTEKFPLMFFLACFDYTKPIAPFRVLCSTPARLNEAPLTLVSKELKKIIPDIPSDLEYYGQKKVGTMTKLMKLLTFGELALVNCSYIVFQTPKESIKPLRISSPFKINKPGFEWFYKYNEDDMPTEADEAYDDYSKSFRFALATNQNSNSKIICETPSNISFDELKEFFSSLTKEGFHHLDDICYIYNGHENEPVVDDVDTIKKSFKPAPSINNVSMIIKKFKVSDNSDEKNVRKIVLVSEDGVHITKRITLLFYRNATTSDLMEKLNKKYSFISNNKTRLLFTRKGKIKYAIGKDEELLTLENPLRLDIIPKNQLHINNEVAILSRVSFVYGEDHEKTTNVPFYFIINKGEEFSKTKERLQIETKINEDVFNHLTFMVKSTKSMEVEECTTGMVLFDEMNNNDRIFIIYPDGKEKMNKFVRRSQSAMELNFI